MFISKVKNKLVIFITQLASTPSVASRFWLVHRKIKNREGSEVFQVFRRSKFDVSITGEQDRPPDLGT